MTAGIRRLDSNATNFEEEIAALQAPMEVIDPGLVDTVSDIISAVRSGGDSALLEFTQRFDRHPASDMSELIFDRDRLAEFEKKISETEHAALKTASARIKRYHQQ